MNNLLGYIKRAFVILVVVFLCSCAEKPMIDNSKAEQEILPVSCVVLLATQIPYDGAVTDTTLKEELLGGAQFLDKTLKDQLKNSAVSRIITPSQIQSVSNNISGGKLGAIKEIGERSHCQTVLMTTLSTFSQRQGGEFAVDSPASASFEMRLIDAETGKILWTATFSETQVSLLYNLFSFDKARSRGFKWITVEELAAQGVHEKLMECPYLF